MTQKWLKERNEKILILSEKHGKSYLSKNSLNSNKNVLTSGLGWLDRKPDVRSWKKFPLFCFNKWNPNLLDRNFAPLVASLTPLHWARCLVKSFRVRPGHENSSMKQLIPPPLFFSSSSREKRSHIGFAWSRPKFFLGRTITSTSSICTYWHSSLQRMVNVASPNYHVEVASKFN